MLIIFGALKIELLPILNLMKTYNISKINGTIIYKGKINNEITLVVKTGMGKVNAQKAIELIIKKYIASNTIQYKNKKLNSRKEITVLLVGFCGAADKNLKTGNAVIYDSIKNLESTDNLSYTCKDILKLKADKILNFITKHKLIRVTGSTVPDVIRLPGIKKQIGKQFVVQTIDIESYWICKEIVKYNTPFYCLRVVSDTIEDKLPGYFRNYSKIKILWKFLGSLLLSLVSPEELKANIKIIKKIKKARGSLDLIVKNFIFSMPNS